MLIVRIYMEVNCCIWRMKKKNVWQNSNVEIESLGSEEGAHSTARCAVVYQLPVQRFLSPFLVPYFPENRKHTNEEERKGWGGKLCLANDFHSAGSVCPATVPRLYLLASLLRLWGHLHWFSPPLSAAAVKCSSLHLYWL